MLSDSSRPVAPGCGAGSRNIGSPALNRSPAIDLLHGTSGCINYLVKSEAETCFRQAIDTASRQSAKSLELRAVMSLSRSRQKQGKKEDVRQMLAEIYGWFTEGFDTADLKEAKALLEELS